MSLGDAIVIRHTLLCKAKIVPVKARSSVGKNLSSRIFFFSLALVMA
jgi:hypothetical protein